MDERKKINSLVAIIKMMMHKIENIDSMATGGGMSVGEINESFYKDVDDRLTDLEEY